MSNDVGVSLSRMAIAVNGRTLSNLRGYTDPETMGAQPSRIMAGGKKAIAFNEYPEANALDYAFILASPGPDEMFLQDLIDNHRSVVLVAQYADADDWPDGAATGITGRGRISRGTVQHGDDYGERSYIVHLNGFTRTGKNAPSITKA